MRINVLYLLDNLCEASLTHQVQGVKAVQATTTSSGVPNALGSYVEYVARDLGTIVRLVVPETRGGLVNLSSTRQVRTLFLSSSPFSRTMSDFDRHGW